MKIIVTDGENRSALAVTRSLGKIGYRVLVTGKSISTLASSSRFCWQSTAVADPIEMYSKYREQICEIAHKQHIDVIIPVTETSIYQLNLIRSDLPKKSILACAPTSLMQAVSNKMDLFRLAEILDIPSPKTFYLKSAQDISNVIDEINYFPVVIKPALSNIPYKNGFLSGKISYAASNKDLEYLYIKSEALQYPSMIQERIIGPGTGLFTLFDTDRHLALFSHRRLREKPPSGGVSVVSESVPLDEEMVEHARRLLTAVGWRGVAMVEFKRDLRDGKAKLMEVNGRFWGTLQLAIICGIDFPVLLLDLLQNKKPEKLINDYAVGHKMKWFLGTLDHLLIRLKNSDGELNLPPDAPSKWRCLLDFLKIKEKNTSFDVLNWHDLHPFLFEARAYLNQVVGRG